MHLCVCVECGCCSDSISLSDETDESHQSFILWHNAYAFSQSAEAFLSPLYSPAIVSHLLEGNYD